MQNMKLKPIVDEESCASCGICAENCPSNAIQVDDTAKINYARCTACGNCARTCPQNAIRLVPSQSVKVKSSGERFQSLRKRAENLGKGLSKIEKELRKLTEASPS